MLSFYRSLCPIAGQTLLFLLPSSASLSQSDEEKARGQLQQLEVEITRSASEISAANDLQDKILRQLRKAEIELGELQRNINNKID